MSKDNPPRPEILPGHGGPIRTPNNNDVLSGRGGRINSHTGNVRFREMVDGLKRHYLDPRTKKIEKARIAARLVATVRDLDPPGRFLKEDPSNGMWIEIGDERAWKKAGQALRESAPEIRAEQQAQLQAAAERAGGVIAGLGPTSSSSIMKHSVMASGNMDNNNSRRMQADPPGPRHRPNPPEREGLSRSRELYQQQLNEYEQQVYQQFNNNGGNNNANNNFDGGNYDGNYDDQLERMRQEYQLQQRIQAEYAKRSAMQQQGGNNNFGNNGFDQQQQNQNQRRFSRQEIVAAMMNEDLLPIDAGFVIPSLGNQNQQQQWNNYQQQQQQQIYQQCYPVDEDNHHVPSEDQVFNGQQFNPVHSCDKTVSTMSSFDVQSMDMSSLGGFSFANHSLAQNSHSQNLNVSAMSGLISTGSAISRSGTGMTSRAKKSSLERKLEKVNEAHRLQQMEQLEKRRQAMQAQDANRGDVCLEVPTKKSSKASKHNKAMTNSLASLGFEDILEEDHNEENSIKMSNMSGLGLSEMDMTFNSDIFSIKSKVETSTKQEPTLEDSKPEAIKRKSSPGSSSKRNSPDQNSTAVPASSVFESSSDITNSHRSSMSTASNTGSLKKYSQFDLENFNESLRSMDLEDRGMMPPDPPSNDANRNERTRPQAKKSSSWRRQKEPNGSSLPSLAAGGKNILRGKSVAPEPAPVDFGISDPDVTPEDFGISLNSIDTNASSWLGQYEGMEHVEGVKNVWDDEASNGSSLSEISAPRMGLAI
jgi:hypothetical protein